VEFFSLTEHLFPARMLALFVYKIAATELRLVLGQKLMEREFVFFPQPGIFTCI
jgi:hypothetical protein